MEDRLSEIKNAALEAAFFTFACLLRRFEMAGRAAFLGRLGEALTLAGVLAFASVRRALASALTLAGVGADAVAHGFIGIRNRRDNGIREHERCCCGCEGRTRLYTDLHGVFPLEGIVFPRCRLCRAETWSRGWLRLPCGGCFRIWKKN
ncbi:protein of unknown function [Hyphomicrobium sp. MC1]|nr:protein of unknown function [Hyphomicrobium sp. MC1]